MRVWVGEADRSDSLGRDVSAQAATLQAHPDTPPPLEAFHSSLILREAQSEADYNQKLVDLLVLKSGGSTSDFYIQRRPGLAGSLAAAFKRALWKVLRYQHERVIGQQNAVNAQLTMALQFLHAEYTRDIAELRRRVAALEKQQGTSSHAATD